MGGRADRQADRQDAKPAKGLGIVWAAQHDAANAPAQQGDKASITYRADSKRTLWSSHGLSRRKLSDWACIRSQSTGVAVARAAIGSTLVRSPSPQYRRRTMRTPPCVLASSGGSQSFGKGSPLDLPI